MSWPVTNYMWNGALAATMESGIVLDTDAGRNSVQISELRWKRWQA